MEVDETLTTPEGRRKAGRIAVQAKGAAVATAACVGSVAAAPFAYFCGVVGGAVAGIVYDNTEKHVEKGAEAVYDWAGTAITDAIPSFGDFGKGHLEINTPDFFGRTELGKAIVQLPKAADIMAGQPPMSTEETYALAAAAYSGTVAMIRGLMQQWNKALDDMVITLLAFQRYDVASAAVVPVAPPNGTLGAYPYDFDKPGTTRAGSLRDALKSYVLLGIIAEQAFAPPAPPACPAGTARIGGTNPTCWPVDAFTTPSLDTTPTAPGRAAPATGAAWFWSSLAVAAAVTLSACAVATAMPKRRA